MLKYTLLTNSSCQVVLLSEKIVSYKYGVLIRHTYKYTFWSSLSYIVLTEFDLFIFQMTGKLIVIFYTLVCTIFHCKAQHGSTSAKNGLPSEQTLSDSSESPTTSIATTLLDSRIRIKTRTDQETKYNLDFLMYFCPYADICSRAGQIIPDNRMTSCCMSCSCHPDCKTLGNCCNDSLNMEVRKRCYWPLATQKPSSPIVDTAYILTDRCLNSSAVDCKSISTEPWGSMYPVYDSTTDTFYYNQHCAECNGVKKYKHWEISVGCSGINTYSNDILLGALYGKKCDIIFTPPKIQLERHICNKELIHQCNVSGLWQNYDASLELACTTWYSPIGTMRDMARFANVFCLLCNGITLRKEQLCLKDNNRSPGTLFTSIIDYQKIAASLVDSFVKQSQENDQPCRKFMVKHPAKVNMKKIITEKNF